jgi:thiol-disulfide isomerase/thioredoxin
MGCPSDTDDPADNSGGQVSGSQDATPENTQAPPGQTEPDLPEDGEEGAEDGTGEAIPGDEANEGDETAGTDQSGSAYGVSVQQTDWDGVLAMIEAHQGKVVVVDLWSLSCPPCLEEFPNLVALSRQYPDDVACISVATDYQGLERRPLTFYEPKVLEFLQENDAQFENVLCITPKADFFERLQIASEPTIFVFNQSGEQAALFTGPQENDSEISYEQHIVPLVESLLASE